MSDLVKNLGTATTQLYELIYAGIKTQRGVHVETAIFAAGILAGYQLQSDSKTNLSELAPGSPVLNLPGVDDRGPMVMDYIVQACRRSGITVPPDSDNLIPPKHQPLLSYLQLMTKFATAYRQLINQSDIQEDVRWIVPTQTSVRFIVAGQHALSPALGQALAMEAVVAGAKTVPPHI